MELTWHEEPGVWLGEDGPDASGILTTAEFIPEENRIRISRENVYTGRLIGDPVYTKRMWVEVML